VNVGALIAVDPHKAHNTLVVLDPATRTSVGEGEFANTGAGYRELMRFARQWRSCRWAVEGCHGAGRSLAQHLVASGAGGGRACQARRAGPGVFPPSRPHDRP